METTMTTPEQLFTAKKMRMIYTYHPNAFNLTQKQLDNLLKTPIVKLEKKLEQIANKHIMSIIK